jgi:proteasome lid subunit RPN8/RPN11
MTPARIAGPDVIVLAAGVAQQITSHAREAAPRECCGLLLGTSSRIDESVRTRNVDPRPNRFQVDPAEHIAWNRRLRGTGRTVVGVYHSHPASPAEPSASDIAEAHYREFIHLIVSLASIAAPSIRAFRIIDGGVRAVTLDGPIRT